MQRQFCVYILSSESGTLYVGVTNNLTRRIAEHKSGIGSVFTAKYQVHRLVFFETAPDARSAIAREKQIKSWRREKKLALIRETNPTWRDLVE
jgi:putative endonuclease